MSFNLKDLFSRGTEKLVKTTGEVLDNLITNKEEREAAKLALQSEINRHEEAMSNQALKEQELQNADLNNARNREIEIAKVTGHGDKMNWFLAIIVMGLLIFLTIGLLFVEIPVRNEHVLILIIGEILGFAGGIYTYQFGSSFGSRLKDMVKK